MKNNKTEILKYLASVLMSTLVVVGAIWFMTGGVIFLPFFVVIFGIFVLSVLVALHSKKKTIFVGVVGGFVFGWIMFDTLHTYVCTPNEAEIKVMNPMAKKIRAYIIKNGIPNSLQDIPDLPYRLKKCKGDTMYEDDFYGLNKRLTEYAYRENKMEICHFEGMDLKFSLTRDLKEKKLKWSGNLRIKSWRGTNLNSWFSEDENGKFSFDKFLFTCDSSGMCRTWRFVGP